MGRPFVLNFAAFSRHIFRENRIKHARSNASHPNPDNLGEQKYELHESVTSFQIFTQPNIVSHQPYAMQQFSLFLGKVDGRIKTEIQISIYRDHLQSGASSRSKIGEAYFPDVTGWGKNNCLW